MCFSFLSMWNEHLVLFCVGLFIWKFELPHSWIQRITVPSISSRGDLVVTTTLSSHLSGNVLISYSIWKAVLPDIGFLVNGDFFFFLEVGVLFVILLALWMNQLAAFWPPMFLMRNLQISLVRIFCIWKVAFLLLLLIFLFDLWKFD